MKNFINYTAQILAKSYLNLERTSLTRFFERSKDTIKIIFILSLLLRGFFNLMKLNVNEIPGAKGAPAYRGLGGRLCKVNTAYACLLIY